MFSIVWPSESLLSPSIYCKRPFWWNPQACLASNLTDYHDILTPLWVHSSHSWTTFLPWWTVCSRRISSVTRLIFWFKCSISICLFCCSCTDTGRRQHSTHPHTHRNTEINALSSYLHITETISLISIKRCLNLQDTRQQRNRFFYHTIRTIASNDISLQQDVKRKTTVHDKKCTFACSIRLMILKPITADDALCIQLLLLRADWSWSLLQ